MSLGRYLYCVVDGAHASNLGPVGVKDSEVYTISYHDLSVVVHDCDVNPYDTGDPKVVEKWVLCHEKVIEAALDKFGTVLPFGFNTIIQGTDEEQVNQQILNWLKDDYDTLREKVKKLSGKAEYGVQISWDMLAVSDEMMNKDPELRSLAQEIENMSEGLAYMNRQKLNGLLKKKLEAMADTTFKEFFSAISACVDDLKIERTKREPEPRQMIMNLSCLASDEAKALAEELGRIEKLDGFFVRFTGPWPLYSFVEG